MSNSYHSLLQSPRWDASELGSDPENPRYSDFSDEKRLNAQDHTATNSSSETSAATAASICLGCGVVGMVVMGAAWGGIQATGYFVGGEMEKTKGMGVWGGAGTLNLKDRAASVRAQVFTFKPKGQKFRLWLLLRLSLPEVLAGGRGLVNPETHRLDLGVEKGTGIQVVLRFYGVSGDCYAEQSCAELGICAELNPAGKFRIFPEDRDALGLGSHAINGQGPASLQGPNTLPHANSQNEDDEPEFEASGPQSAGSQALPPGTPSSFHKGPSKTAHIRPRPGRG